ncbi:MAG: C4-dicarboxylate ABC transporter substrate-binding protein [Proteobacteria bacterium]|nr:MAG: C4-dicarboxylate ABC transporter substrate-binding protein [Pseudomonadota bacterium]
MKKTLPSLALASLLAIPAFSAEFITIGTGGVTGTYYPTGGAVCRFVNKMKKQTGIRCSVESTGGSVYNINTIRAGELDFGLAQSDVIHYALNGERKFKGKPYKGLKSAIAIYPELLTLTVNKKSGIKSLKDIKGKRINIDVPGSGTRATTKLVLETIGIGFEDLGLKSELRTTESPNLVKDNKIDGYFSVFGHPTANIKDTANSVEADIVPIDGEKVNELIKKYPYYAKGVISGTFYKGITHDTPSIGVKAVLVTDEKVSEKAVYTVVKAIMDNFEDFKKLHPAYKTITKESMLEGLTAPLHKGAAKYFKEAGLLK